MRLSLAVPVALSFAMACAPVSAASRDSCIPLNATLSVCKDVQGVAVSLVDATPKAVLGIARLRSKPELFYVFHVAWDISASLEEYANAQMQEQVKGSPLPEPSAVRVEGFPAIRYDLKSASTAKSSAGPRIMLFIDTGAGIATIVGHSKAAGMSSEDVYAGAQSVARILRVRK